MIYHAERLAGLPASDVSPAKAVAARAFPVLLICDADDVALPCRHRQRIFGAARGRKQMWVLPGAYHTAAQGTQPDEFRRRVLGFYESVYELGR
jgi:pimeloyl-ACP methyl ester carboxylesterase